MRTKRVIEITIETRQVTVIRRPRPVVCAWCATCAEAVEMVTAEWAAVVMGQSVRAIYRQVELGRFHFNETAAGTLRLCLNSVLEVSAAPPSVAPEPPGQTCRLTKKGD